MEEKKELKVKQIMTSHNLISVKIKNKAADLMRAL
jgi:hypothetical protein